MSFPRKRESRRPIKLEWLDSPIKSGNDVKRYNKSLMMTQRSIVIAVSLTLLVIPMLCGGGIAQHHDHNEETGHCGHSDGCPLDPCQKIIIIQKAPDRHIDGLSILLRACPIASVGDDASIQYWHSHSLSLRLQINLPFPMSDVPLLI